MYEKLKADILACLECAQRFGYEPHPVVTGHARSKIMQISQAPSRMVHETLRPWNDASGKRLRGKWYEIEDEVFYNPDNFYITAMAHCYPGKAPGGGDRLPPKLCAEKWLWQEIEQVDCELFVVIGGRAAAYLFPKQDFTGLVFNNQRLNGKPAYVLPHPSPLNVKWFKDHPEFEAQRIAKIRKAVHNALGL